MSSLGEDESHWVRMMTSRRARWDLAGRDSSLLLARNLKTF
ncbi:hypothetical protein A2U01_0073543, partial [Trifolium medium]|nr:hypothetical protein [Trifolium medium]